MRYPGLVGVYLFLSAAAFAQRAEDALVSHMPAADIVRFVVAELDAASFSSMLGPSRPPGKSRFSELGLAVTETSEDRAVLENDFLTLVVRILARGDANRDGIEDLVICFSEDAKEGTGKNAKAFVAQKHSATSPLVAVAYNVSSRLRTPCEGE